VSVEKAREDGDTLHTVFFVDSEGQEYKLAFSCDHAADGVKRWESQQSIAWARQKG